MLKHKLLRIASNERNLDSISSTDFQISYNNAPALQSVKKVVVKSISVPNVEYNIVADLGNSKGNNEFIFLTVGDVENKVVIPVGQYNINELIAVIVADPLSIAVGMAINLNNTTGKLEFTTTADVSYNPYKILGITEQTIYNQAYNALGFPSLGGDTKLYIASTKLSNGSHLIDSRFEAIGVLDEINVDVPFGSIQHWESKDHELNTVMYDKTKNINSFDIKLFNDLGRVVDLGSLDWVLILRIYYI